MKVKPKKCKGTGKAKNFVGCGKPVLNRKYGLCMDDCYKVWLFTTEAGKNSLKSSIIQGKKKVRKKIKSEDFKKKRQWRQENKSLRLLLNEARTVFQKYIRLRDDKKPCISCGTFYADIFDGGHYFKAEIYSGMIFDEMNVHKQCRACNRFQHGNEAKYRIGLLNRYGSKVTDELEQNSNYRRDYKYTRYELIGLKRLYKYKLSKLNSAEMRFKKINVPKEKKEEIINFFKTEKNNTIPVISEKFGYSTFIIGKIITEYYSTKNN